MPEIKFIDSRGNDGKKPEKVGFSEAILNPSASFGGLYVPETLPRMEEAFYKQHLSGSYQELAKAILIDLFEIDLEESVIDEALSLYAGFDNSNDPAPLIKVKPDLFVSELWHGPTRAFKDMALQPFGKILSSLALKRGEEYLIMAATSGDTGPATLRTFSDKPNIRVSCLYPLGGTSDVQRLQMVTEGAQNLKVMGIEGNFDDAQSALKSLLGDADFIAQLESRGIKLSAANSVNFGRIIFQIIYHIWSYLKLVHTSEIELGEEAYFIIPSGNFGNALGLFYAKKMGLPVKKILIASNQNNILTDFITTGVYDLSERSLIKTASPAMDILKSSNVERMLFSLFGAERTKAFMAQLDSDKHYALNPEELTLLQSEFTACFCDDAYGGKVIKAFMDEGYLMDPHTATSYKAYETLRAEPLKTVICSTAEWTKFAPTVCEALNGEEIKGRDYEALNMISEKFNVPVPPMIGRLFEQEITQKSEIKKEAIKEAILDWL